MATVLGYASVFTTTAGNKQNTASAGVEGHLIVVICCATGTTAANANTTAVTDNHLDGQGFYTAVYDENASQISGERVRVYVRNSPLGGTGTFNITAAQASSTGGGFSAYKIAGMSRFGADAIRQIGPSATTSTAHLAAATPSFAFPAAVLTGNPTIVAAYAQSLAAVLTEPVGWVEGHDLAYATPSASLETARRDSGFTGTTVTWGSTWSTAGGSFGIEFDTSAPPVKQFVFMGGRSMAYNQSNDQLDTIPYTTAETLAVDGRRMLSRIIQAPVVAAGGTTNITPTAGAITVVGQAVTFTQSQVPTAGAVAVAGQASTIVSGPSSLTSGTVSVTGRSATLLNAVAASNGTVTVVGKTVTLAVGVAPSAGAVAVTGQAVALKNTVAPSAGTVTLVGGTVTASSGTTIAPTAGAVSVVGKTCALSTNMSPVAGIVSVAGQTVTATVPGAEYEILVYPRRFCIRVHGSRVQARASTQGHAGIRIRPDPMPLR